MFEQGRQRKSKNSKIGSVDVPRDPKKSIFPGGYTPIKSGPKKSGNIS